MVQFIYQRKRRLNCCFGQKAAQEDLVPRAGRRSTHTNGQGLPRKKAAFEGVRRGEASRK